jgi:hypothetical protein
LISVSKRLIANVSGHLNMNTLRLSQLIGQEILDIRFHYLPENEYGLQSFQAYIKLTGDVIIDIPKFDEDEYLQLTQDNLDYLKRMFETGRTVIDKVKANLVGQKITNFYFSYYNDEVDFDHSAFIKLSNSYYLTENNFGPIGLTNIDLIILDEEHFVREVKRLNDIKVDVRPITKTNKNAC